MRSNRRSKRRKSAEIGVEKRVFSRTECLMDLELRGKGRAREQADRIEAVDLSLLGLGFERIEGSPDLNPGDTVTVEMHGLNPVTAKVRWNRGERVGVQFCGRFQDIIESWVGEVLAAQGVRIQDLFSVN